jgi:hypothetical protein
MPPQQGRRASPPGQTMNKIACSAFPAGYELELEVGWAVSLASHCTTVVIVVADVVVICVLVFAIWFVNVRISLCLLQLHDVSESQIMPLLSNLVTIIYGYAYDHRTTEGEPTSESPWLISILSATLSWFESFSTPQDAAAARYDRQHEKRTADHKSMNTTCFVCVCVCVC